MLVDHEKAWQRLKAVIADKKSHGQRDLLAEMARIEVDCSVEEGLPEKALRLYGVVLSDDLLRPTHADPRAGLTDGQTTRRTDGAGATVQQEDQHGGHRHPAAVG